LDALELIEREHDRLHVDLAGLICAALADKRALAKRILRRLSAYLLAEEQCLFPALFATLGSETPLAPLNDHQGLKRFVAELLRMEPMEASFAACVSNLQGRLRGYRTRQRKRLYPLMRRTFSPGELQLMGGEMQLFLYGNRRVGAGTTVAAEAMLETLRALVARAPPTLPGRRH
jgi:hypothetical protein